MPTPETTDEKISLHALKTGDRKEFARLVDLFSGKIYRLLLKILNNQQDAEDMLQETFIKAFRALPEFQGRSTVYTWLHRIAVNEALMLMRKRQPVFLTVDHDQEDDDVKDPSTIVVDWCCLPEQELVSSESMQFLDEAVSELPANLRLVFVLRDIEGLSIKETSEILNISEMNVKTRLFRARSRLREVLSSYFSEHVSERTSSA